MAGQRPTVTEEVCDGMQYFHFALSNGDFNLKSHVPLFICEKRTAIEEVTIRYEDVDATATGVKLSYQVSGKALGAGGGDAPVDITDSVDPTSNDNVNQTLPLLVPSTGAVPTNNLVPAGAVVFVHAENGPFDTFGRVALRIRTQTKIH